MAALTASTKQNPLNPIKFNAGGAIPANSAVKLSAEGTVVVTSAITDNVIGFCDRTAASGDAVQIDTANGVVTKAIAGGSITAGDQLMPKGSATNGTVVLAAGATAKSCAIALQDAASGETFMVLTRFGVNIPANS